MTIKIKPQNYVTEPLLEEARELKESVDDSVLNGFNDSQLWYLYLALRRINLVPELKGGTDILASYIQDYGVRLRDWCK